MLQMITIPLMRRSVNKEKNLSVYLRLIKSVAILMYKVENNMVPAYIADIFARRAQAYDIRNGSQFSIPSFNTITFGKKSLKYYGPKLWSLTPGKVKHSPTLSSFKTNVTKRLKEMPNISIIIFNYSCEYIVL